MALTESQYAEFNRLLNSGVPEDEAAFRVLSGYSGEEVNELQAGPPDRPWLRKTQGESAAAGAAEGAMWGNLGEFAGVMNTLHNRPALYPAGVLGNPIDRYRRGRDTMENSLKQQEAANPKTFLAAEIGSGVASGVALPAVGEGAVGAVLGGAAYGAAGALGKSEADLTRGEYGQAGKDMGVGALVGGITGGVLHGGARLAKGAVKKGAEKLAGKIDPQAPSQINPSRTVRQEHAAAMKEEAYYSDRLGEPYQFAPHQTTGDPAVANAEKMAEGYGPLLRSQQDAAIKRTDQDARLLDLFIDDIAKRGDDVDGKLSSTLEQKLAKLRDKRSQVGKLDYADAEALLGSESFDVAEAVSIGEKELGALPANAGDFGTRLRKSVETLKSDSSFKKLRAEQQYWSAQSKNDGTIIDGLDGANARRIAGDMAKRLQAAIDAKAESGAGPGVESLRVANKNWRANTEEIKKYGTELVNSLMKAGGTDKSDTLVSKLVAPSTSEEQIRGVFRVLNEESPEVAGQVRAQMIREGLEKQGLPTKDAFQSKELGVNVNRLDQGGALGWLYRVDKKLMAAYEGDKNAISSLRRMYTLLQRAEMNGKLRGANEASPLGTALSEGARAGAWAAGGVKGGSAWRAITMFLNRDHQIAKAVSTPEGINALNRVLEAVSADKLPSERAQTALLQTLIRAGLVGEEEVEENLSQRSRSY